MCASLQHILFGYLISMTYMLPHLARVWTADWGTGQQQECGKHILVMPVHVHILPICPFSSSCFWKDRETQLQTNGGAELQDLVAVFKVGASMQGGLLLPGLLGCRGIHRIMMRG